MTIYTLLHLLSDGQFHSGSELGESLGLSRTSIWKAISQLDAYQLTLETVKGKGYRIPGGLDLLDKEKIQVQLSDQIAAINRIDLLLTCTSTNDYMASQMASFSDELYVICLAEQQTAGRGRRGRQWISPFARNIYLSVGFRVHGGVEALSGMSLVVGLAVASALTKMGVQECGVKWPNDVLVAGKKICGVLIELQGEATTGWEVVCGIGLNVSMSEHEGRDIDQAWTALQEFSQLKRNAVASNVIKELLIFLALFKDKGFSAFLDIWRQFDCLYGCDLELSPNQLQGVGKGVDAHGALLIESAGELLAVNAGEVSVRRK